MRAALGALGYWSLAGCGGGGSASVPSEALLNQPQQPLLPVTASDLAAVRARPEAFLDIYDSLAAGASSASDVVRAKLGAQFSTLPDAGCLATYASLLSNSCAPLGSNSVTPIPATLQQLLAVSAMACGHYCKLATMLTLLGHPELIPPDADDPPAAAKPTVHFLVWLDTVPLNTGFHSQLLLSNLMPDAYLLLDPTYAYALRVPYVGAGPVTSLTAIENAATMLQTPIGRANLVVLDPAATASQPDMLQTILSGALGPQYIFHDSIYGSEGWDNRVAQLFDTLA
jgi:hypothetical protein